MKLYIDTFPAYAAAQMGVKQTLKNLPPSHELRAVIVEVLFTLKQGAAGPATTLKCLPNTGAAVGGTNDALTIANALFSRFYLKMNEQAQAYNIVPVDLQIAYGNQHGFSMLNGPQLRDGDALVANGASALNYRMDFIFDFNHSGFETPNKFTPGTEQASLNGGWEISYDTNTGAVTALANGNVVMTITQVRLLADVHPVDVPIVGPTWFLQQDQEATENSERRGQFIELLVYETALPGAPASASTLDAALTNISIWNDGILEAKQLSPTELANAYARSIRWRDSQNPFAVERNCSVLRWVEGKVAAEEREMPITLSGRTINFLGSSATRNMRRHRISPQRENAAIIQAVMNQYGVKGNPASLPVRFPGRDPIIDNVFGTRLIA